MYADDVPEGFVTIPEWQSSATLHLLPPACAYRCKMFHKEVLKAMNNKGCSLLGREPVQFDLLPSSYISFFRLMKTAFSGQRFPPAHIQLRFHTPFIHFVTYHTLIRPKSSTLKVLHAKPQWHISEDCNPILTAWISNFIKASPTTSFLTATASIYAIGAGITHITNFTCKSVT